MKVLSKTMVFTAVCFLTWWATSALFAKPTPGPNSQSGAIDETSTTNRRPASDFTPIVLGRSGAFAEMYLRSSDISIEDGVATVKAHVSIADARPGMSYLWRLRVVDSKANPIAGRVYDQQIFSVEETGQKEAEFADIVEVPIGAYRIELGLYEKAPGKDLAFLNDDTTARGYQVIRVVKLLGQ